MKKFLLPILFVGATTLHAQSFLLQYYSNDGIPLETDATATYSAAGGLTTSKSTLGGTSILLTPSASSPLTTALCSGDTGQLFPDSGVLKDYVSSQSEFQYHVGDATTADSFSLKLTAHASALTAQLSGFGADAQLVVHWRMQIEGQSLGIPTISYGLPDVTTATTVGTWSATWGQGFSGPPVNFTDVTHGGTQTVVGGSSYEYDVTYTLNIPFGTDPDISALLNGTATVTPVPELNTAWQVSLLLLPALWLRRQQGKRVAH